MREHEARAKLLDQTLEIWQPRTSRKLTREDARQIVENITGFFRLLLEWEIAAQREATAAEIHPATATKQGRRQQ